MSTKKFMTNLYLTVHFSSSFSSLSFVKHPRSCVICSIFTIRYVCVCKAPNVYLSFQCDLDGASAYSKLPSLRHISKFSLFSLCQSRSSTLVYSNLESSLLARLIFPRVINAMHHAGLVHFRPPEPLQLE